MLLIVLNFIRQHWLLVVEVILLSAIGIQHLEISHLNHRLAECISQNAMLTDANAQFASAVNDQNAAVAKLQADSKRKNAEAAKSLATAKIHAKTYAAKAQRFEAWKLSGDDCIDMARMLNDYVRQQ